MIGPHKILTRFNKIHFKFRGWGTESGLQPHIEDNYQKQREELYETAWNRETLSALSLAFTSPRCVYLCIPIFPSLKFVDSCLIDYLLIQFYLGCK